MKKLFVLLYAALFLVACGDPSEQKAGEKKETTATNKSDSKVYISSGEFNLSKGDEQLENYFADKAHIGADLNKGKTISGVIQYDVEGPGTYELIYTPTFSLDAKEIKWKISVK